MKHVPLLLAPLAAAVALPIGGGCARAEAQTAARSPAGATAGRGSIDLVVYAGDFAMVRETRHVDLKTGRDRIGLQDVSKGLDQNSVLFDWPKTKDAKVVSSAYDLGVGDSGRLLKRFLGREVELVYRGQDGRPGDRTRGVLEVADPGNVVVRADGRYIVNPEATIEAPADQGIVAIPQLSAEVESGSGGPADLRMTYMTGGLSWSADYTLTLAPDRDTLGLECWATVTNRTGTDYPDAKISFVAGSPNRAVQHQDEDRTSDTTLPQSMGGVALRARSFEMNAAFSAPQAMGELYAYPYKSTATIRQDRMNRVRMMGSETVRVKRVYTIGLPEVSPWSTGLNANPDRRIGATLGINFANGKGDGLGLPLPAGAVRVYEPDPAAGARYVGAASLGDTPKDARVSLELTSVFDVYARARQVEAHRIDKKRTSRTVEVVVSNEKTKPVEVRMVGGFGGAWKITGETAKSLRPNAASAEWRLTVPAGGETKLRYTVTLG